MKLLGFLSSVVRGSSLLVSRRISSVHSRLLTFRVAQCARIYSTYRSIDDFLKSSMTRLLVCYAMLCVSQLPDTRYTERHIQSLPVHQLILTSSCRQLSAHSIASAIGEWASHRTFSRSYRWQTTASFPTVMLRRCLGRQHSVLLFTPSNPFSGEDACIHNRRRVWRPTARVSRYRSNVLTGPFGRPMGPSRWDLPRLHRRRTLQRTYRRLTGPLRDMAHYDRES